MTSKPVLNGKVKKQYSNLHVCMLALPEMAAWQIKTTRQLLQASILARDVVDTFSKRHYFLKCIPLQ